MADGHRGHLGSTVNRRQAKPADVVCGLALNRNRKRAGSFVKEIRSKSNVVKVEDESKFFVRIELNFSSRRLVNVEFVERMSEDL